MTIDDLEPLHPEAFRWTLGCCGWNAAEAEDVMQIAYVKVLEGRARFDGRSSLRTWWFGVLRRTASDLHRRRRAREMLAGRFAREPRPRSMAPRDADSPWTAESHVLVEALGRISRRQREVVLLVFGHIAWFVHAVLIIGTASKMQLTWHLWNRDRLAV